VSDILTYIEKYLGRESQYCACLLDELSECFSQKEANDIGKKYHAEITYYSEYVGVLESMISIIVRSPLIVNVVLYMSISSGIGSGTELRYYDFESWSEEDISSHVYKKLLR
jgi:lantibiotic modifying enzyme